MKLSEMTDKEKAALEKRFKKAKKMLFKEHSSISGEELDKFRVNFLKELGVKLD